MLLMKRKTLLLGIISSLAGAFIGTLTNKTLLSLFPDTLCDAAVQGVILIYDCPSLHPLNWAYTLPLIGFSFGPLILNLVHKMLYKTVIFNTVKILILGILVFMLLLVLREKSLTELSNNI